LLLPFFTTLAVTVAPSKTGVPKTEFLSSTTARTRSKVTVSPRLHGELLDKDHFTLGHAVLLSACFDDSMLHGFILPLCRVSLSGRDRPNTGPSS
jgi:hypothetical protein